MSASTGRGSIPDVSGMVYVTVCGCWHGCTRTSGHCGHGLHSHGGQEGQRGRGHGGHGPTLTPDAACWIHGGHFGTEDLSTYWDMSGYGGISDFSM